MRGQHGTANYPQFLDIVDAIGYNPAVWLHTRSKSGLDTGQGQTPELATAMAIVKGIANAHGWEISVTESDAGGARFEIRDVETA